MASQEVILRPGDSIALHVELAGKSLRLDLRLTEEGIAVGKPVEVPAAKAPAPRKPEPPPEPAFEPEAVEAVDLPMDDMSEAEAPVQESPVEVADEGVDVHDDDFALDEEQTEAPMEQHDSSIEFAAEPLGSADRLSLTGVPGVAKHEETDLSLDEPDFNEQGLTMVPPSRSSRAPAPQVVHQPEPEPLLEMEAEPESAQPLEALSASLSPVKFHDPSTDNLEQSDMQERRPAPAAPARPAPQPVKAAPAPGGGEELPPWTGRARDYRDPKLEAKKAATAKLDKSAISARQQPPAPPPAEEEPLDLGLSLDDEPAQEPAPARKPMPGKPAPAAAKPAPAPMAKPAPAARPAPAPAKPAPAAAKPAPVPAKPAPAPASASAKVPAAKAAEGNFTVFLSPPKGADKKQAAAEIIAEVQGIDIDAALQLAGKMIVPVVKGVTEEEANRVRDRLKDAGLSSRITQKR